MNHSNDMQENPYIAKAHQLKAEVGNVFTEHPHATGETYFQHLWFTIRMSLRFLFLSVVILLHGVFPFLCVRTASIHIEDIYKNMKKRAAEARPLGCDGSTSHGENI